jgi:hypothetical protein
VPSAEILLLVYFTVNSGLPSITATYGGDSQHAGSSGHTQFLGMGTEGTYEAPTGPSGQYPNEVVLNTEVPVNGTTVEGTVQGPDPHPIPVPIVLPGISPALDASSAADLRIVEASRARWTLAAHRTRRRSPNWTRA